MLVWIALILGGIAGVAGLALVGRVVLALDVAWVLSAALVALMFSTRWALLPGLGALPVPPDRLLFALALVMFVVQVRDGRLPAPRLGAIHAVLGVAAVAGAVSLVWSTSSNHKVAAFGFLDAFGIVPFIAFAIAPAVFHGPAQRSILLKVLVVTGAYLGLTAVFESLGLRELLFPRYIGDPSVGLHYGRARGPFVQAGADGLALYGCAVAGVIACVTWTNVAARRAAGFIAVLCLVGTFLTLTRSIWVSSVAATFVGLLMHPAGRRLLVPVFVAGAILGLGTLAVLPGLSEKAKDRQKDERPIWDRYNTDKAAITMIGTRPITGFGYGSFIEASVNYVRQSDRYPLTGVGIPVHNVFLSYAVELGLPGAAVWLIAWLGGLVGTMTRRGVTADAALWRAGLAALVVHWFVSANFTPIAYPFPLLLLWLWAGVLRGQTEPREAPAPAPAAERGSAVLSPAT